MRDVATIIRALEKLYSLRPEDSKHLAHSSKWHQVVVEARKKACIHQSRRDSINEWSTVEDTLDPIPYLNNNEILKELARCFTSEDNPAGSSMSNIASPADQNSLVDLR